MVPPQRARIARPLTVEVPVSAQHVGPLLEPRGWAVASEFTGDLGVWPGPDTRQRLRVDTRYSMIDLRRE